MSQTDKLPEEFQTPSAQPPPWIGFRPEGWKEDSSEFVVSHAGMHPVRHPLSPRRRVLLYLALLVAAPMIPGVFLKSTLPLWAFALGGMLQLAIIARGRDSWDDGVWGWILSAGIVIGLCWLDAHFLSNFLSYAAVVGLVAFCYGALVRQTGVRKIIILLATLAAVHASSEKSMTPVYILCFLGCLWAAIWGLILPRIPRLPKTDMEDEIWNPSYGLRLGLSVAVGSIAEYALFGTRTSLGAIAAACIVLPEKNPSPLWLLGGASGAALGAALVLAFLAMSPPLPLLVVMAALLLCVAVLCSQRIVFCFTLTQAACMVIMIGLAAPDINLSMLPVFLLGLAVGVAGMLIAPRARQALPA